LLTQLKATPKYHFFKRLGVRRAACPTPIDDAHDQTGEFPGQKTATKQPRKHSAKYLLRQGEYVENWNSPGCELSELYRGKSPKSFTPSPPLSSISSKTGNKMFSFSTESPTFPSDVPCSSSGPSPGTPRSPFLAPDSEKQSPILANFADLAQSIMMDFKPVAYSTHALSAVTDTFWDSPAVTITMPSKPSRVLGLFQSSSSFPDAFVSSPSIPYLLSPGEPDAAHQCHGNSGQLRLVQNGYSLGARSGSGLVSNGYPGVEDHVS
jgi:hypothetical protein